MGTRLGLVLLVGVAGSLGAVPLEVAIAQEADGPSPYESSVEPSGGGPVIADLEITRRPSKPYIGNDVYNTTGVDQTITKNASPGDTKRFVADVHNDGVSGPNWFLGNGSGKGSCFRVRYLFGQVDLTRRIVRGGRGHLEAGLPPGSNALTIEMKVRRCALSGFSQDATLSLGPSDGIPFDRVVARVNVVSEGPSPLNG